MDDVVHVRLQLLEVLYRYLGEFVAWSQLYEAVQPSGDFPSPRMAIPWIRLFIRAMESDLARVMDPGWSSRGTHRESAYQQYLLLRLWIDRARFNRIN